MSRVMPVKKNNQNIIKKGCEESGEGFMMGEG